MEMLKAIEIWHFEFPARLLRGAESKITGQQQIVMIKNVKS